MTTAHFYAIWSTAPGHRRVVEEFSAATGQPLRKVVGLPPTDSPYELVQGPDGWIWYSRSTGPILQSNVAGGDPKPDSCSGAVVRLDPADGRHVVVLGSPRSEFLGRAVPSPDGRYLAYVAGPCARSFMNLHYVVRDLLTGSQWNVASGARVCHDLSGPAWVPARDELVFGYGPSSLGPSASQSMGYGICQGARADVLALSAARQPASIDSARTARARKGCGYVEAVADAWGFLALEQCGHVGLGAASLVQLTSALAISGSWHLPPAADGTTLSVSPDGKRVLVDEYEAPIYSGTRTVHQATDWIEVFDGQLLRLVRRLPDATSSITGACW